MLENTDNTQTEYNPEKANNAKQQNNYTGLVAFYDTQPASKVGLFYNTP